MDKWNFEKKGLDFLANAPSEKVVTRGVYKVLIADDDEQMHTITKVMLEKFVFEGHRIEFIDAYTGEDTMRICAENPDIAVLFLDVVMEDVNTGLHVVQYIRNELKNKRVRIILRTGQPGEAPEEEVIRDYDINDYRLKTELSVKRLYTSLFSALRNYRDIMSLEKHQEGLKKIIQASAHMFEHNSLDEFLVSILEELANFQKNENFDMMYLTEMQCDLQSGFVTILENNRHKIVAGTGKYKAFVGNQVEEIIDLQEIYAFLSKGDRGDSIIHKLKSGILIESKSQGIMSNFIFVEGHDEIFDLELINVFLVNFSIALNNYILNHIMNTTQKEIVYALTETVESHFGETGSHVKRISEMMYRFAIRL